MSQLCKVSSILYFWCRDTSLNFPVPLNCLCTASIVNSNYLLLITSIWYCAGTLFKRKHLFLDFDDLPRVFVCLCLLVSRSSVTRPDQHGQTLTALSVKQVMLVHHGDSANLPAYSSSPPPKRRLSPAVISKSGPVTVVFYQKRSFEIQFQSIPQCAAYFSPGCFCSVCVKGIKCLGNFYGKFFLRKSIELFFNL